MSDTTKFGFTERQTIFTRLSTCSCMDTRSLEKLCALSLDVAQRKIPGDIVECGVYNGGSAGALVLPMEDDRTLWLYDSFEGLPAPHPTLDHTDAEPYTGQCKGNVSTALSVIQSTGFGGVINVREGWFKDTFLDNPAPHKIAILHIDADWYEGTIRSLYNFYNFVSPGGIVILDDFGHWEGCRRAFYEFCADWKVQPLLERYGHTVAWWQKDKENNRDARGKWELP
jgi:O-methyltransferase